MELCTKICSSLTNCESTILFEGVEEITEKRLEMWSSGDWFLHHDNAPAHTALSVHQFWAKNMTVIPHPPYSPDLAPCDFFPVPSYERPDERETFC